MEIEKLLKYDRLGHNYWWLRSKYVVLSDLLEQSCAGLFAKRMLDIGCGSGVFLGYVKQFKIDIFGIDLNHDILNILCKRNQDVKAVVADAIKLPFKENSFDLVTLLDVLEHVDDEDGLIVGIKSILNSAGWLLVSVPAYNALYGKHDELYGHKRRYNRKRLTTILEKAGFRVLRATYFQPAFVLPLWFKRKILVCSSQSDDFFKLAKPINAVLNKILCMEKYFLRRFDFPFGTTLACLAQKS